MYKQIRRIADNAQNWCTLKAKNMKTIHFNKRESSQGLEVQKFTKHTHLKEGIILIWFRNKKENKKKSR